MSRRRKVSKSQRPTRAEKKSFNQSQSTISRHMNLVTGTRKQRQQPRLSVKQKSTPNQVVKPNRPHTRSQGAPLWEERDDINKISVLRRTRSAKLSGGNKSLGLAGVSKRYQPQKFKATSLLASKVLESIEVDDIVHRQESQDQRGFSSPTVTTQENEYPSDDSSTNSETFPWLSEIPDAEDIYLQQQGYTVPLSNEILATVDVILGREAAIKLAGMQANDKGFRSMLLNDRNVSLTESKMDDSEWKHFDCYKSTREPDMPSITTFLDTLWREDLEFCHNQQEAIFQRTIMMAMINRHQLLFAEQTNLTKSAKGSLMFSVETKWSCPPMPTRRYAKPPDKIKVSPKIFATAPKPDLCISFRLSHIVESDIWQMSPPSLQHLMCYENIDIENHEQGRAFGFFFIEAKRSRVGPEDHEALSQALNDARQELHNLYEFFNEAQQALVFFQRVRVFSVTTSEQGNVIRVHWAESLPEGTERSERRIVADYPLSFKYQIYKKCIGSENFIRSNVVRSLEAILVGYGEGQLLPLLQTAAEVISSKVLKEYRRRTQDPPGKAFNDYLHGQIVSVPKSRAGSQIQTPVRNGSQSTSLISTPRPSFSLSGQQVHTAVDESASPYNGQASTSCSQQFAALQASDLDSLSSSGFIVAGDNVAADFEGSPRKKQKN